MSLNPLLSADAARALTARVLRFSTADDARVTVRAGWSGNTRFSGGEITTAGGATDTIVTVTSTIGKRRASATTNLLDDAALKRTVELSERLARLAPEDPEIMPELGPQEYATVPAYQQRTAELGPEARALAVQRVFDGVRAAAAGASGIDPAQLFIAGFLEASAGVSSAIATKGGLFAYHPASEVTLSATVRTPDGTGSGYARTGARDWADVDPAAIGARAARKAIASRDPQAIEPGQYTVVLEPQAVADILPTLMGAFNARSTDEGRSAFSKAGGATKLGERIADPRVTLYSDPTDPELLSDPFDEEGFPIRRTVWIENGVLRSLAYSRYWAAQKGVQPTGSPRDGGLKMVGTDASVDDLIAGTERGILVTRFWYIRFLDQRTVMVTGLTRDGTFLIERGKVTRPLKNFRWNESPLFMLNKIDAIGRAERTTTGLVVPSLRVKDWNFTSLSDAV